MLRKGREMRTHVYDLAVRAAASGSTHWTLGWIWLLLLIAVSIVMIFAVKSAAHWAWILALILGFATYAVFAARISPWLYHTTGGKLG
jgi:hypothetical protein